MWNKTLHIPSRPLLLLLLTVVSLTSGRFVLQPGAYLKLPNGANQYQLNSGTATKAAYDPQENFLYVAGHRADVLHVVDLTDPSSPRLLDTKVFDMVNQGLPDSVQVCRGGLNRNFLAVSFESSGLLEKGHVHFYGLLDAATASGPLTRLKDVVTTDSFDPRSLAWNTDCTQLVVVSEGIVHELNGAFEDPPADIEILIPSFGTTVDRRSIPIVESEVSSAELRQVFKTCDTGATTESNRVQDLEPTAVHVDAQNTAYILFSDNNGIAKLNLSDPSPQMSYFSLGRKDWSGLQFDGSYDDGAIKIENRTIQSFYQPRDMVTVEVDGKVWLATADTGAIRRHSLSSCTFDESIIARSWNQDFSDGLSMEEIMKLQAEMNDNAQLGRLSVSKLRTTTDGWDPIFQGFDFVTTFGGRGFSILDPSTMERMYDSGDDFERYFTGAEATESEKALFNGNVGVNSQAMSSQFDRRSPELGPMPSAITTTEMNGMHLVIVANGVVGGLYTYSVDAAGPAVNFESFIRRGQPGLTWNEAYARDDDSVGEPYITDLLIIDDQNQKTVVAVSSYAGSLSFYSVQETP